jgi:hypothetical protein
MRSSSPGRSGKTPIIVGECLDEARLVDPTQVVRLQRQVASCDGSTQAPSRIHRAAQALAIDHASGGNYYSTDLLPEAEVDCIPDSQELAPHIVRIIDVPVRRIIPLGRRKRILTQVTLNDPAHGGELLVVDDTRAISAVRSQVGRHAAQPRRGHRQTVPVESQAISEHTARQR